MGSVFYRSLAVLFAGMVLFSQSDNDARAEEPALQLARLDPAGEVPTQLGALPRPLGARDTERYRQIFSLQEEGRWAEADRLIRELDDPLLLGHVQAQRYLHPTAWRSTWKELSTWLESYADLPQSRRIYKLALARRPEGAPMPAEPVAGYLGGSGQELVEEQESDYPGPAGGDVEHDAAISSWLGDIAALVSKDRPTAATRLLNDRRAASASPLEMDLARWKIARGYFVNRKDELALDYAGKAAARSGEVEPRIHWTAGLAAWRLGRFETAARHFAALATGKTRGEALAAGAFWAARAWLRAERPEYYSSFLQTAAAASDGFYGLLARTLVGQPVEFDWHEVGLRGDMLRLLNRFPGSRRAIALAQVGQPLMAEKEIRKLAARARPELSQALAALAESLGLPAAQMRVAQRLRLLDGRRHDGAMYPLPPWEPENGYGIDRALLFSLVRAESGFDQSAQSHAGALGLMQMLPGTAKAVARAHDDLDYDGPASLKGPERGLAFGQAYVEELLENRLVKGDLVNLALAYNAGLSRLEDWSKRFGDLMDDPLLYIESIPVPETRHYAKKVLANLWAYRARLGQPIPSLEALAANDRPTYVALDGDGATYARAN